MSKPDFKIQPEGNITILYPETEAAEAWIEEYILNDEPLSWSYGIVVEHHYVDDILRGIGEANLTVAR